MLMAKSTGSHKSKQGGKVKSALTSLGKKAQGQSFPILHQDIITYHVALD
jgi:hypothetical protein